MPLYSYDMLRTFQVVAKNLSMTEAALKLNQSKGYLSIPFMFQSELFNSNFFFIIQ